VGKVYLISRCQVKAANKQYSKIKNDYELTFKASRLSSIFEKIYL
jgi:replication factor A1